MRLRYLRPLCALAIATAIATLTAITVQGQAPAGNRTASSTSTWQAPRTPDGGPDLQGNWANNRVTPLARAQAWTGKTVLNDEEIAQLTKLTAEVTEEGGDAQFGDQIIENALAGVKNPTSSDSGTGNYNHFWLVERTVEDRRTALII